MWRERCLGSDSSLGRKKCVAPDLSPLPGPPFHSAPVFSFSRWQPGLDPTRLLFPLLLCSFFSGSVVHLSRAGLRSSQAAAVYVQYVAKGATRAASLPFSLLLLLECMRAVLFPPRTYTREDRAEGGRRVAWLTPLAPPIALLSSLSAIYIAHRREKGEPCFGMKPSSFLSLVPFLLPSWPVTGSQDGLTLQQSPDLRSLFHSSKRFFPPDVAALLSSRAAMPESRGRDVCHGESK